jgi:hypothetical protein
VRSLPPCASNDVGGAASNARIASVPALLLSRGPLASSPTLPGTDHFVQTCVVPLNRQVDA